NLKIIHSATNLSHRVPCCHAVRLPAGISLILCRNAERLCTWIGRRAHEVSARLASSEDKVVSLRPDKGNRRSTEMSTNVAGSPMTAVRRNELSRSAHAKAISGAMHDVGIIIGLLFAGDKAREIWSRSEVGKIALILAAGFFVFLVYSRAKEWKLMNDIED